jgi:hypothetical protein
MTILKTVGRHPTLGDVEVLEKMYVNDGTAARQCSREPWLYLGFRKSSATVGMPRMIFLLQPNIEESLNPVRRPCNLAYTPAHWLRRNAELISMSAAPSLIASKQQAKRSHVPRGNA